MGATAVDTSYIVVFPNYTLNITKVDVGCGETNGSASVGFSLPGPPPPPGFDPNVFLWSPGGETTSSITGLSAGIYTVTVIPYNFITQGNCAQTATVAIVTVGGIPVTGSVVATTSVTCSGGNDGSVTVTADSGVSPFTYTWSNGQSGTTANNLSAGNYTFVITDVTGCSMTQVVTISQPSAITLTLNAKSDTCSQSKGSISVTSSGGAVPYIYLWSNNSTSQSLDSLLSANYTLLITDANGCTKISNATVSNEATATVIAGNIALTINKGDSIQLNPSAPNNSTYTWSPAIKLSCVNCENPFASPDETTTYTLTITDENGCTATDVVTVNVEIICTEKEVFVPNSFSPNADGYNDVLYVRNSCITIMTFTVYNRWGEKVFESSDPINGWDGNYKNKPIDIGVYSYYLNAILLDGETHTESGSINLVR